METEKYIQQINAGKLTRPEINALEADYIIEYGEAEGHKLWNQLRIAINDYEAKTLDCNVGKIIDILGDLAEKIDKLTNNHMKHLQADIDEIKEKLCK